MTKKLRNIYIALLLVGIIFSCRSCDMDYAESVRDSLRDTISFIVYVTIGYWIIPVLKLMKVNVLSDIN